MNAFLWRLNTVRNDRYTHFFHQTTHRTPPSKIPGSVNLEAALAQASDLLRCAGASASEAGKGLSGLQRDLVLSVMHLAELAKGYVDKSLDTLATHGSSTRLSAAGASWDSWFEGEGVTEDFF